MRTDQPRTELHQDHASDTDNVWAWIIIGLVAAGVILAIWSPTLKAMLQTQSLDAREGWFSREDGHVRKDV
jgi:hypothetical protein